MQIDARGLTCPKPVVLTLEALPKLGPEEFLEVLVNDEVAVGNLTRLAEEKNCELLVANKGRHTSMTFVPRCAVAPVASVVEAAAEICEVPAPEPVHETGDAVIAVGSDSMGRGSEELGRILIKGLIYALAHQERVPKTMLFFNSGARLTCAGRESLDDIREHGLHGERGPLQPMTHEVLDTFRALGAIQRRNGVKAARRYIISFTKSAKNVRDVYELNRLSFANPEDAPVIDVIPLFEQLEDLENSVNVLDEMIKIPEVQARLKQTGRKLEVMLGYSDSSKDAGPTTATLALHAAQERIAKWADENDIDLTLFHGRGGAVGRGGGPANRAVLAQPKDSVKCRFKLTEQGEVIFARYGNPVLAIRHVESVAAATLLQSAPSVEKTNTEMTEKFAPMASKLNEVSHETYLDLLNTPDFAPWFSTVTPLTEIGLLPIGSRPAKRGLGAKSLDDLRTIPWIFSWAQARINLAAWYGLGSACEAFGDLDTLRKAYQEWPLFSTFIDNIEMSLAKTDERIAKMYLALGDRDDLRDKVLNEMELTRKWVLKIVGDAWPLQHRHVLGQAIRIRSPYVDALSVTQVLALRSLRKKVDKEELSKSQQAGFIYLILCTVSGVAAGLQNTG